MRRLVIPAANATINEFNGKARSTRVYVADGDVVVGGYVHEEATAARVLSTRASLPVHHVLLER